MKNLTSLSVFQSLPHLSRLRVQNYCFITYLPNTSTTFLSFFCNFYANSLIIKICCRTLKQSGFLHRNRSYLNIYTRTRRTHHIYTIFNHILKKTKEYNYRIEITMIIVQVIFPNIHLSLYKLPMQKTGQERTTLQKKTHKGQSASTWHQTHPKYTERYRKHNHIPSQTNLYLKKTHK